VIDQPSSSAATNGTVVAKYLELVNNYGGDTHKALAEIPAEHKQLCLSISLEKLPLAEGRFLAEASFQFELATGKAALIGCGATGKYPNADGYAYGTADIVAVQDGVRGYVGDYKYGDDPHGVVPAAAENEQLAFYALYLSRAYGLDDVAVEIIRIRPSGYVERDLAVLDSFALDAFEARIHAALAAKTGGFGEGDWCHYCPSYRVCPAKTALIRAVATTAMDDTAPQTFALTDENAAAVLERVKRVKVLVERMEEQVDAYAREHPIQLGDGYVYGPVEEKRRSLDGDIAYAYLVTNYGQPVADAAVTSKVTITQESAAKAIVDAGKATSTKAAKEGLIVELERAGGVRTAVITKVRRHK
jgi:hypothetical protein